MKIEFSKKEIYTKDLNNVLTAIKSGWLTHGKFTELFERNLCKYTNSKYAITVSSCTAALHLSCIAAGFKKGDEVIVPAMTHVATAHAVELTGAKAVIADINYATGNLDLTNIKKKISKKTKGIILVHMAGLSCDMKNIIKFCKKKKILLIEDCAHALGTKYKKRHVGNFGFTGNFSFYPTKQITTGEGGAIITNNKFIYEKLKKLRAFGIDTDIKKRKIPGMYDVKSLGLNYRFTDFQAALGLNQIKNYSKNLILRKRNAFAFYSKLKNLDQLEISKYDSSNSYFVFQIFSKKRDQIIKNFRKYSIGFSIHYLKSINDMSYYKKKNNLSKKNFLSAYKYSKRVISLPVYPKLKIKEINFICKVIKDSLG